MDVTKLLEADHRSVESLFKKLENAEGDDRQPLIDELAKALTAHMELEEQAFYPAIESVVGQEAVQENNTEHDLARRSLADMLELAPDDPGFGAAMDAAKAGIAHHVGEEEDDVFPKVRRDGAGALDAAATPFMTRRLQLGLPMPPEALADASTKDELVEEARKAGIDVNSSMTKADLASALSDAMAG